MLVQHFVDSVVILKSEKKLAYSICTWHSPGHESFLRR